MGSLTGYEPRSQYQLNIKKIIPIGDGLSSMRLKRLREKLEGEGLFDPEQKKPLPRLPRKVGIITSKDSAAITEFRHQLCVYKNVYWCRFGLEA